MYLADAAGITDLDPRSSDFGNIVIGDVKIDVLLQNETIWLPQKKIAQLFDVQRPAITKHLKNIFESGELDENVVCSILELPTQHGAIKGKTQKIKTKFLLVN